MSQYDSAMFYSRKNYLFDGGGVGMSVPGTAAADTELIRLAVTESLTVDEAAIVCNTGGTAAGPIVQLGVSVGGTGAFTAIGTQNIGTAANSKTYTPTIASTSLAIGDHLVLMNKAGTVASTPKITVTVGYKNNLV